MPQGGESITTAASQAPFNFATHITILGLLGAVTLNSKSFSTNLPSTAVKFP